MTLLDKATSTLAVFVASFIAAWAFGAFVSLEINPLAWLEGSRTVHLLFTFAVTGLASIVIWSQ